MREGGKKPRKRGNGGSEHEGLRRSQQIFITELIFSLETENYLLIVDFILDIILFLTAAQVFTTKQLLSKYICLCV